MNKKKVKVLCVCGQGLNRSKYLAGYLKRKGYETRFGGVDGNSPNPINDWSVKWSDVIVIARERHHDLFKKKFGRVRKKIIVLNVADSKNFLPEEYKHFANLDYYEFQRKWTYPQLRKAIKSYLPL